MKILLDECLPVDFSHPFTGHQVHTAEWAGFKGKQNGELLREAELAGYEVLLTVEQGIPHQQDLIGRRISIITFRPPTNRLDDLLPFVTLIRSAVEAITSGAMVNI